jgi:hypothetical protein
MESGNLGDGEEIADARLGGQYREELQLTSIMYACIIHGLIVHGPANQTQGIQIIFEIIHFTVTVVPQTKSHVHAMYDLGR